MVVKAKVKYFDELSYFFVIFTRCLTRVRTRAVKNRVKNVMRIKIMD